MLGIAYCGFYLCRRLAKLNRVSGPSARRSTRSNEQGHDRGERNEGIVDPFCYVACDEPFLNHLEQDSNLPPAYAEVKHQLYFQFMLKYTRHIYFLHKKVCTIIV